jgi:hypothetical protein
MPTEALPKDPPAILVQVQKSELDGIRTELARLSGLMATNISLTRHLTGRLDRFHDALDAISGECHDTHETVKSIRAEQVTLAAVVEHAKLLREIHEREVADKQQRRDKYVRATEDERDRREPDLSDTERPSRDG